METKENRLLVRLVTIAQHISLISNELDNKLAEVDRLRNNLKKQHEKAKQVENELEKLEEQ